MENGRKKFKFEILLSRYFTNFHRIVLTNLLFAVPSAVFFAAFWFLSNALFKGTVAAVILLSIIPLFPFYAGVVMVCRNIARGDTDVKVVSEFFFAIKDNFRHFLVHGLVVYVITTLSVLAISLYVSMLSSGWFFYALLFFCIIVVLFLAYTVFYLPLMSVTYDLPLRYIYKNSFLMSFGEFKNNFFATLALAVVFAICFTVTMFAHTQTALIIMLAVMWAVLIPATCTFMIVFFIYDGMTKIIRDKEELSRELTESIDKQMAERQKELNPVQEQEDFSDIDISALKDTDDYIFHNGRMVKQSTLLRMIKEREQSSEGDKDE